MKTRLHSAVALAGMLAAFVLAFLMAGRVAAVSSPNYRLDWFGPLTGGGGSMASAHYGVSLTVGQSLAGTGGSPSYRVGFSDWPFNMSGLPLYLPVIQR